MFLSSHEAISIFQSSIRAWHINLKPAENPYGENSIKYLLFKKNQVDTIQWHLEDEIRRLDLHPAEFIAIKREIDKRNQERTDLVEEIDDRFIANFADLPLLLYARLQSESPAWMLDRMSILELKIHHMSEQTVRTDVLAFHVELTAAKLEVLVEQRTDLSLCFDSFLDERNLGTAYFKLYRQMKMYNDEKLNPSLYKASI